MKRKQLIILLLAICPLGAFSQMQESSLSKKEIRKSRPTYINLSAGLNISKLRDFATSPLFYNGTAKTFSVSRLKADDNREIEIGLSYGFGNYSSSFNGTTSTSQIKTFAFNYSQLYAIRSLSTEKWNVRVGALFNTTGNFRVNPILQNNSTGLELFSTLFGSVKATRDISSLNRFLFFKLKPADRTLSFRFNLGLMNNTYRNGYAYSGQEGVLNDDGFLKSYEFKAFSGARFSSALDYTVYLKNKNGIRLSYEWDAYKTGGNLDQFEMSNHTLKIALLFNKK
ncbi:hypothetical protein L3049_19285 [Labilibaculum sp. DW002]|uniref:Outer membrane protein beta-barrel domain-containing protein n=1 Tax=Paralabilibaculum antarcticum TaxID=2912572 RepID=A0ABT5VXK8_9BACT|nr:hypothetical protein [Labilibaculum sp. DW002]MDE5420140.1 hypothetical protein [Labilibaculum sp. DW002]